MDIFFSFVKDFILFFIFYFLFFVLIMKLSHTFAYEILFYRLGNHFGRATKVVLPNNENMFLMQL